MTYIYIYIYIDTAGGGGEGVATGGRGPTNFASLIPNDDANKNAGSIDDDNWRNRPSTYIKNRVFIFRFP